MDTNVRIQPSNWLKSDDPEYTRENRTVATGTVLPSGTVVQAGAANLDVEQWDGAGDVLGVVYHDSDADFDPLAVVIVARGPAIAGRDGLVWKTGATQAEIDDGIAKLAALGIITREQM